MKKLLLKLIECRLKNLKDKASKLRERVRGEIKLEEGEFYFSSAPPAVVGLSIALRDDAVIGLSPRVSTKYVSSTLDIGGMSLNTRSKLRKIQEKIWTWEGVRDALSPLTAKPCKKNSISFSEAPAP